RIAFGIDQLDLAAPPALLVKDAPAALFPRRLPADAARLGEARAPLHEPRTIVERVTERGDVELRDVREDEGAGQSASLPRSYIPATILKPSLSWTRSRRLSATVCFHSSPFTPGIL